MSTAYLITAILVFSRFSGFIGFLPAIGFKTIPVMTKILLIVCLTIVVLPVVPEAPPYPTLGILSVGIFMEFFFGMLMSWVVNLVFAGLITGTELISTQIGQAAAKQFNPSMNVSQSPLGGMAVLLAMAAFMGANLHLLMIKILADSFQSLPPGNVGNVLEAAKIWVVYSNVVLISAVKIAGPILTLVLLNNSFLAVLSRLAPNMNVFFSVGFLVSMIGGLILFGILFPNIIEYALKLSFDAMVNMRDMIERASGS